MVPNSSCLIATVKWYQGLITLFGDTHIGMNDRTNEWVMALEINIFDKPEYIVDTTQITLKIYCLRLSFERHTIGLTENVSG